MGDLLDFVANKNISAEAPDLSAEEYNFGLLYAGGFDELGNNEASPVASGRPGKKLANEGDDGNQWGVMYLTFSRRKNSFIANLISAFA